MKFSLSWTIQIILILALGGGIYLVYYMNNNLVEELNEENTYLEQAPLDRLQKISMETELERRQADIEKMKSYLVQRNDLVRVISYVEEKADERGVQVAVPNITERVILDPDTGAKIPTSGPVEELVIDMNVFGDSDQIINFLYDVEHSPYLLRLDTWEVSQDSVTTTDITGTSEAPEGSEEVEEQEGEATVSAVVTVWRNQEED